MTDGAVVIEPKVGNATKGEQGVMRSGAGVREGSGMSAAAAPGAVSEVVGRGLASGPVNRSEADCSAWIGGRRYAVRWRCRRTRW